MYTKDNEVIVIDFLKIMYTLTKVEDEVDFVSYGHEENFLKIIYTLTKVEDEVDFVSYGYEKRKQVQFWGVIFIPLKNFWYMNKNRKNILPKYSQGSMIMKSQIIDTVAAIPMGVPPPQKESI